jgi:hypothetical protein
MKYKSCLIITMLLIAINAIAQDAEWIGFDAGFPQEVEVQYLNDAVQIHLPGFYVQTDSVYSKLRFSTPSPYLWEEGKAALPVIQIPFAISANSGVDVSVQIADSTIFSNFMIEPQQPDRMLNDSTKVLPFVIDEEFYASDEFWPATKFHVTDPVISGYVRSVTVTAHPFRWNPESQELIVYHDFAVVINEEGTGENPMLFAPDPTTSQNMIYADLFPNYQPVVRTEAPFYPSLLVIVPEMFSEIPALDDWIKWKRQIGYAPVVEIVSDNVTTQEVYDVIHENYTSDNLIGYVQLIGGHEHIPMIADTIYYGWMWERIYSDNWYAMQNGNDESPDLCIGRFSAEPTDSALTVQQQVEIAIIKNLFVEQNLLPDWNAQAIELVTHLEHSPNNPYEFIKCARIVQNLIENNSNGFFSVDTVFGIHSNGTKERAIILIEEGSGRCDVFYNGHGGHWCWWHWDNASQSFESWEARLLENNEMLPRMYGFACNNSPIQDARLTIAEVSCFNPNGGALTYLGGTANTSYGGNYYHQIYLSQALYQFDICNNYSDIGSALFNAKIRLQQNGNFSCRKNVFWYILIGDVTSKIRHRPNPQPLAIDAFEFYCEGQEPKTMSVSCNNLPTEGAIVTMLNATDSTFVDQQSTNEAGIAYFWGDVPRGEYLVTANKPDFWHGTETIEIGMAPAPVLSSIQFSYQGHVCLNWFMPPNDCFVDNVTYRVYISENPYELGEVLADVTDSWYVHTRVWVDYPNGAFYKIRAHDGSLPHQDRTVPSGPWPDQLFSYPPQKTQRE